jgi:hypothetical protein
MAGLFARLFGHGGSDAGAAVDGAALLAAVERAVTKVEPRLRQAGGYPDHYRH